MAANGKNSRRKKKRHIKKGPVLIAVILLLCGIGWLTYLYHEQIINKAKDIPNSFSYPTDYEEYVIRYSTKYKCDPVLVFSVIKVESGFNKDAVSSVGARGLMQLMEDAYDWIKYRLGDQPKTRQIIIPNNGIIRFDVKKSNTSNSVFPASVKPLNSPKDKVTGIPASIILAVIIRLALRRDQPQRPWAKATIFSNNDIDEDSAATNSNKKKATARILPPGR